MRRARSARRQGLEERHPLGVRRLVARDEEGGGGPPVDGHGPEELQSQVARRRRRTRTRRPGRRPSRPARTSCAGSARSTTRVGASPRSSSKGNATSARPAASSDEAIRPGFERQPPRRRQGGVDGRPLTATRGLVAIVALERDLRVGRRDANLDVERRAERVLLPSASAVAARRPVRIATSSSAWISCASFRCSAKTSSRRARRPSPRAVEHERRIEGPLGAR